MKFIKINFYLDESRTNGANLAPIRLRSKHNSARVLVKSTGLFCDPAKWRDGKPRDPVLRNKVEALRNAIEEAYASLPGGSNLNDIWGALHPAEGQMMKPKSVRIVDWIDHYRATNPYGFGYSRGAEAIRVHLCGVNRKSRRAQDKVKAFNPDLRFDQLNQSTVDALCRHIVDQGRGMGAAEKVVKFLRVVAKVAANNGVTVGSLAFKLPKNYKKRKPLQIRLTFAELMKIQRLPLDGSRATVRDMFLLSCFTGLRHSDLIRLTPANCHGDYLHFRQTKTVDEAAVTLHRFSKPLVKKYTTGKGDDELLFPPITQQAYNRMIKEITREELDGLVAVTTYRGTVEEVKTVGKYTLVRSHTGRRTFSRLLAFLRVDESIIAEEMGHGGGITRHYIGNNDHEERIRVVQRAWSRADVKTLRVA